MAADSTAVACIGRGNEAFVYDDYSGAVSWYTKALEIDPSNTQALVLRSHARNQIGHHLEASQDATKAIELDPSARAAHLHKGYVYHSACIPPTHLPISIANFYLDEYESALDALQVAAQTQPDAASMWIAKCKAELAEEAGDAATQPANGSADAARSSGSGMPSAPEPPGAQQRLHDIPVAPCAVPARDPYRLEWFQTHDAVEVAVLAKGLTGEQVSVDIRSDTLVVRITNAQGALDHCLDMKLFAEVDPAASRWTLLRTKVEIMLKKASAAHWPSLDAAGVQRGVAAVPTAVAAAPETAAPKPHYPSSSRRKVDWDKVDHQIQEELKEDPEGDPLQGLFQQIYAGADEDTRRAMNKSFQESGGTVLSTNWKEVGAKKVEYVPPASD